MIEKFRRGAILAALTLALCANAYAMSKNEAADRARATYGGKVLSVEKLPSQNGRDAYRVKLLLPGGKVKVVVISE